MPSGQTIVNGALITLGLLEQGGDPSVSDANDALAELNSMWDAWGIDENLIYAIASAQFGLTINTGIYPMGPAAAAPFNVAIPGRIYGAVFLTATSRTELALVEANEYLAHGDQAASAKQPDELYPDFNVNPATGSMTLNLFPVPNVAGASLELHISVPFTTWTMFGMYFVPEGYQDAIQYALAWRLLPRYGVAINQQIAEVVRELGMKAEVRIIAANSANRRKPPSAAMAGGPGSQSPVTPAAMAAIKGIQPA